MLEQAEVVGAVGVASTVADVLLDARARVHAAGSASARPSTTSMAEIAAELAGQRRARRASVQRQRDALAGELDDVGPQQRAEVDVAERASAPGWLTTRIISSGVMPLAASEATNEPALVPT